MKAPRYARQIRESDCGPIALLNVLKWAGAKVSLKKHHKRLSDLCQVQEGFGTSIQCISLALSHIKKGLFSFRYSAKPTLKSIDDHLRKGGCVVLVHPNDAGMHVSLIIEKTKRGFRAVNIIANEAVTDVNRKAFRRWVRAYGYAWFITRIGTATK